MAVRLGVRGGAERRYEVKVWPQRGRLDAFGPRTGYGTGRFSHKLWLRHEYAGTTVLTRCLQSPRPLLPRHAEIYNFIRRAALSSSPESIPSRVKRVHAPHRAGVGPPHSATCKSYEGGLRLSRSVTFPFIIASRERDKGESERERIAPEAGRRGS